MPPKHKDTKSNAEISSNPVQAPQGRLVSPSTEANLREIPLRGNNKYPVETLLLVCRSWTQAALEDAQLWSKFVIGVTDLVFWSSTLPRRLGRCPQTTLLDVNINLIGFPTGNGRHEAMVIIESYQKAILLALTGSQGETARRWRKVVMRDHYSGFRHLGFTESPIAEFLCHPTPNLQELRLRGFCSTLHIFPSTPVLKVFSAYDVMLSSFPDLSIASDVSICIDGNFQEVVAIAVNVVKLRLFPGKSYGYSLSTAYPRLRSLHLIHGLGWQQLEGFSAPTLQELSLQFETVVACKSIQLHKIQRVCLESRKWTKHNDIELYRDKLLLFLKATTQVKVLIGRDYVSDVLLVHLMDSEPLYPDHTVLLKLSKCSVGVGCGKDRLSSIKETRRQYGGLPTGTWSMIRERLDNSVR